MNATTTLAASVQAKKGRLYAVIQVRENGRQSPYGAHWDCPRAPTNQR